MAYGPNNFMLLSSRSSSSIRPLRSPVVRFVLELPLVHNFQKCDKLYYGRVKYKNRNFLEVMSFKGK
jgi:hypothetical protein